MPNSHCIQVPCFLFLYVSAINYVIFEKVENFFVSVLLSNIKINYVSLIIKFYYGGLSCGYRTTNLNNRYLSIMALWEYLFSLLKARSTLGWQDSLSTDPSLWCLTYTKSSFLPRVNRSYLDYTQFIHNICKLSSTKQEKL